MSNVKKTIAGAVALGTIALTTFPLGQGSALASADALTPDEAEGATVAQTEAAAVVGTYISVQDIQGEFAWDQEASGDTATLRRMIHDGVSQYVCGARDAVAEAAAGLQFATADPSGPIDCIRIDGDVSHAFFTTVEDCLDKAPIKTTLGCTCAGNPADGRASANANVTGFSVKTLIEAADPVEGANAITFTSRDGYQVTLPLSYVMQRHSVIVTEVGGAAIDEALGCENQLWLGATSARAFVQDVVDISITVEPETPAAPGGEGVNQPNVGVISGEATA